MKKSILRPLVGAHARRVCRGPISDFGAENSFRRRKNNQLLAALLIVALSAGGGIRADESDGDLQPTRKQPARVPTGNGLVPHLAAFDFEPWYELDDQQLWQHIGWKVRLKHLPDDVDRFVELMRSELFRKQALDIDWQIVLSVGVDRLAELPNIESVTLSGGIPITSEQFREISRLPRLRHLDLRGLPIGNEAMQLLSKPSRLERLNLSYTGVNGLATRHVARYMLGAEGTRMRNLSLYGETFVSDAEYAAGRNRHPPQTRMFWFSRLAELRWLSIPATGIAEMDDLTLLSELRVLDLHDPTAPPRQLKDNNFAALSRIARLRVLRLDVAPTDKQLTLLRPLTRLERIDIAADDQATEEFRQQLARTLPQVRTWVEMSGLDVPVMLNLRELTLDGFVRLLATQSGVPIHIDATAVESSGINMQTEPLDQTLPRMTRREVLTAILNDFELIVIPHSRGLTVTSSETESVWEQEYDLSPLLEDLDTGDHHAARLAQVIESLTDELEWGHEASLLPLSNADAGTKATTRILSRGTQLVVVAGVDGQQTVARIVDQILNPESLITGVKFRAHFDRSQWYGWGRDEDEPGWHPVAVNFADTPLVDTLDYLGRTFAEPFLLDHEGIREAGVKLEEPINIVDDTVTLSGILDRVLNPLKLTWVRDGDDIVVTSQERALKLATVAVHQFDDKRLLGSLRGGRYHDTRDNRFRGILSRSGMPGVQYAFWLNRTLVAGPFQSQLKLTRLVQPWLDNTPAETAVSNR